MSNKAKKGTSRDENTAMHDERVKNFNKLSPDTQSKLDDLASAKGYDGFMGMVRLFWEQKIYPYFSKALYGPQEGFENLLQRLRNWVKGVGRDDSPAPDDGSISAVLADVAMVLQKSNLTPEQSDAAVRDFLGADKV